MKQRCSRARRRLQSTRKAGLPSSVGQQAGGTPLDPLPGLERGLFRPGDRAWPRSASSLTTARSHMHLDRVR